MFEFHNQKKKYFDYQYFTSRDYLLPFIEATCGIKNDAKILEIGCGEAGVLKAFLEKGFHCTGIELVEDRVTKAKNFLPEYVETKQVEFIVRNIYDIDVEKDLDHKFDVIILKDVIEHIPDQAKFIARLGDFLTPQGKVFFGFPPWTMPFGGHQQLIVHKWLSKTPWFHILPKSLYRSILKAFNEPEHVVKELMNIHETGISTHRFESIMKKQGFKQLRKKMWLLNPIYKWKFNKGPIGGIPLLSTIPILRDLSHTCAYYVYEKPST